MPFLACCSILNGQRFPEVDGTVSFTSGLVAVTGEPNTAPFTATGTIFGRNEVNGPSLSTMDFIGRGNALVFWTPEPTGAARLFQVLYEFEDASPVPEPSSVLLLSGAMLTVLGELRRRKRSNLS